MVFERVVNWWLGPQEKKINEEEVKSILRTNIFPNTVIKIWWWYSPQEKKVEKEKPGFWGRLAHWWQGHQEQETEKKKPNGKNKPENKKEEPPKANKKVTFAESNKTYYYNKSTWDFYKLVEFNEIEFISLLEKRNNFLKNRWIKKRFSVEVFKVTLAILITTIQIYLIYVSNFLISRLLKIFIQSLDFFLKTLVQILLVTLLVGSELLRMGTQKFFSKVYKPICVNSKYKKKNRIISNIDKLLSLGVGCVFMVLVGQYAIQKITA